MACGIYSYRDIKNDFKVIYVGQSKNIYKRHRGHLAQCHKNKQVINKILQKDPTRYSLQIEIECEIEQLDSFEKLFIAAYEPKFNFHEGGKIMNPPKSKGKYTLWDNKKTYYISHKNQNRNRPFRLYYNGHYIGGCYFEEWFSIDIVHKLIKEATN